MRTTSTNENLRGLMLVLCAAGVVACASTPPKTPQPTLEISNAWETLDAEPYPGKRDDISFVDAQTGWYGTGKGDLYRTRDGGAHWEHVAQKPGTFIRALAFLDEDNGFIGNVGVDYYPGVTDTIPLYRTADAGRTWHPVDLGEATLKGVCAIDVLQAERIFQGVLQPRTIVHAAGRVGGPAGILRSVDGGETWSVIDMKAHAGMILDIKFFTEQIGLVFAGTASAAPESEGLILRTEDGGESWTQVYRSGRKNELMWKVSFPNRQTGYATLQSYDPERAQQLIVKTQDGGLTWAELPLVQNAKARQFGVGFLDENHGWVGTFDGGFYTPDGGRSFEPAPVAKGANKFRVVPSEEGTTVFAIGTEVQKLHLPRDED